MSKEKALRARHARLFCFKREHAEQSLEQQLAAEPAITRTEALSAV
jgi:hypothetical protein